MKKGLLGSTALVAATALTAGMAQAAEAPTWKLSGFMNFQVYMPSGDITAISENGGWTTAPLTAVATTFHQDAAMYFGVDDAEMALNVSGTADNGLEYGFKIEFEGSTSTGVVSDEARIQLGGSWGTLQLGDEDGAEDTMNYGGENLLGAAGAWDGDGDDVMGDFADYFFPTIAGDTSDHTKVTYYSPRFSGLQVGVSFTPEPGMDGDEKKFDKSGFENHFGIGVNYDGSFGDVRVRASGVYSTATSDVTGLEDVAAYSIGGIVGFGPVEVGANWTDNGDSAGFVGDGEDSGYWNVAVGFTSGPLYLSGSYFAGSWSNNVVVDPDEDYTAWALTADYDVAPGLTVYAEYTSYNADFGTPTDVSQGVFIAGANVSF